MKLIEDLGSILPNENCKQKVKFGIYECPICKIHFKARTPDVLAKKSTKCKSCSVKVKNTTHGDTGTRLFYVWSSMKSRCYNYNNKRYNSYGKRGISICNEWKDNYLTFKEWAIHNGYKKGLTLNRINNDGNYEPSNCRWTTYETQARNTRKIRSNNSSGYRGVQYNKQLNRWSATIMESGKSKHIGLFDYPHTAAYAYDSYILNNNLEHTRNFI